VIIPASHSARAKLTTSFSYGNLYFAKDAFPGCAKAIITTDVAEALKTDVEDRFVIGPVVDRDFWKAERAEMHIDRGPCESKGAILTFTILNPMHRETPTGLFEGDRRT
jgi:uridine phosphorylase